MKRGLNFIWPPAVGPSRVNVFQAARSNLVFVIEFIRQIRSLTSMRDLFFFFFSMLFSRNTCSSQRVGKTKFDAKSAVVSMYSIYIYIQYMYVQRDRVKYFVWHGASWRELWRRRSCRQSSLCDASLWKHNVGQVLKRVCRYILCPHLGLTSLRIRGLFFSFCMRRAQFGTIIIITTIIVRKFFFVIN